jgi:hypothetical protein
MVKDSSEVMSRGQCLTKRPSKDGVSLIRCGYDQSARIGPIRAPYGKPPPTASEILYPAHSPAQLPARDGRRDANSGSGSGGRAVWTCFSNLGTAILASCRAAPTTWRNACTVASPTLALHADVHAFTGGPFWAERATGQNGPPGRTDRAESGVPGKPFLKALRIELKQHWVSNVAALEEKAGYASSTWQCVCVDV